MGDRPGRAFVSGQAAGKPSWSEHRPVATIREQQFALRARGQSLKKRITRRRFP